ncbi:MAG: elongation factor G [Rhodobiaceae bacterium]|nr:elongation factor G [Rhodobiaceae bacterium]MCC0015251.1 elongation factor G [Rhodobiaceae bacterium]MCC0042661.1 elongation factor G [Rhodobiaceae bacterium]MCC0053509.1 elongation factor G [Rhodobiaceae bacterium]
MGQGGNSSTSGGGASGGGRAIALIGPYLSGKTTLLEAILARNETIARQGRVSDGNTVGDSSPQARAHGMSVEVNIASTDYLGDTYTFFDCPGSVEYLQDMRGVLPGMDLAIVVLEPDEKKIPALQAILKEVEDSGVPHMLFLNKVDKAEGTLQDMLALVQKASSVPVVLRQLPIYENGIATGFIDLALERAFVYREHAPSEVVPMEDAQRRAETEARYTMLEQLADYDDKLMEQLLEDIEPPQDLVFDDLAAELREGQIVPLLFGSAEHGNGIGRLMKAMRHEAPGVARTAARLGVEGAAGTCAQVVKTIHTSHGGKLSVVRVLAGSVSDGSVLKTAAGEEIKVSGMMNVFGQDTAKADAASAGATVGLAKLEEVKTGDTLSSGGGLELAAVDVPPPVMAFSVAAKERKDEVKLAASLHKLIDEDPSLLLDHNQTTGEMILSGQGDMHLRVALEKLMTKYGVSAEARRPRVGYCETIRKGTSIRGRHKKQSGGHGQFGDVVLDIKPMPRGSGFVFDNTITGGVVPKQYIPSVEHGVKEYLLKGPLGFPVIDVSVTLTDGSFHTVDSSDMAFRTAAQIGMREGMPQCAPVLLEPIMAVEIHVPNEATARMNQIIAQRRGQILGFDARAGWEGWDTVQAQMPAAEIGDLIVELRSATAGVGGFSTKFDHWQELTGRLAEQVVEQHAAA